MLLTADIERPQELALVERRPAALVADVMLVPHHGSRTSSSDAFLDTVRPSAAIVQAGYLNRFGHPRPDVMARYAARGIDVLRNDRDGAITVTIARRHDRPRSLSRPSSTLLVRPLTAAIATGRRGPAARFSASRGRARASSGSSTPGWRRRRRSSGAQPLPHRHAEREQAEEIVRLAREFDA